MISYKGQATAVGGREGAVATSDGALRLDFLRGTTGAASPEQLFAACYATCFYSALKAAAEETGSVLAMDSNVTATVTILQSEDLHGGLAMQVDLQIDLPCAEPAEAEGLLARAHQICPYSRALTNGIQVSTRLV